MPLLARRIQTLGTENAFSLGEDIARCQARGIQVLRLNLGEPDFDTPAHINEAAARAIRDGDSHYVDPQGRTSLRGAIAAYLGRTRGLDVDPARIVVTPGAKPPIGYTMQAYVEPGDEVIYPSPGFPIYESWIDYVGAKPVPLPLDEATGFTFTAEQLAALITPATKVIFLCSPSNPTGGVLSIGELAAIAAVIRERCSPDVRVYSDEIYEHILYDGATHHSIAVEPGMAERTILVSGHSKGYAMTGWRLGYAVLPTAREAAVFKQLNINAISCVPPFVQEAGRAALEDPCSSAAIGRMVAAFQARRDWIVPALNAIPGVRCQRPRGAFYVFPNVAGLCDRLGITSAHAAADASVRGPTSPSRLLQRFLLHRHGLATMDRASFGSRGAEGQHFLRLSIATSIESLEAGVSRLAAAADDAAGFAAFAHDAECWA